MLAKVEVAIIGGGQAGMAAGYYLARNGVDYLVLDRGLAAGSSWRSRYDSLVLFTPRMYSQLPGMPFPGDAGRLPTKDETADYLSAYATRFGLKIRYGTTVNSVAKEEAGFVIHTDKGQYSARAVIIATGPFQQPWIPDFAKRLSPSIVQLHSSQYINPGQLTDGDSLVVGAGNSGAQIAYELSGANLGKVALSAGHRPLSLPMTVMGKNIFYWFDKLGILSAPSDSWLGRRIRSRPDPLFGLEFKRAVKQNTIELLPKSVGSEGISVVLADGSRRSYANIIWSTGFRPEYSWLDVPGIINEGGGLIHRYGVTSVEGLYAVGLPWQSRRSSALIGGVEEDARAVVDHILAGRQHN
ncbi:flavin-containing monooxygenase [Paenibacillus sp. 1P07SE]|uniref:flavin-containing monooxygenase n=1 Tax=Paenibacillus sp. 1P07SE TaxID=3132209 RepID=UPI0039A52E7A